MSSGLDTTSDISLEVAQKLKSQDISFVVGYLSKNWKGLTIASVKNLKQAGIYTVSVFETSPTQVDYFSINRGYSDANAAYNIGQGLGQPHDTAQFFAVDYDATESDLSAIISYAESVDRAVKNAGYIAGFYGSGLVLSAIRKAGFGSKFWLADATGWTDYQSVYEAGWWCLCQGLPETLDGLNADPDKSRNSPNVGWLTAID